MPVSIPNGPSHDFIDVPAAVQHAQAYALSVLVNNLLKGCGRAVLQPADLVGTSVPEHTVYEVKIEQVSEREPCTCLVQFLQAAFNFIPNLTIDFGHAMLPDAEGRSVPVTAGRTRKSYEIGPDGSKRFVGAHIRLDPRDRFQVRGKQGEWVDTSPEVVLVHELAHLMTELGYIPESCGPLAGIGENAVIDVENVFRGHHRMAPRGHANEDGHSPQDQREIPPGYWEGPSGLEGPKWQPRRQSD